MAKNSEKYLSEEDELGTGLDALTDEMLAAKEEEREKIASLLHTSVGQILTGASLKAKHLTDRLEGVNPSLARDARVQHELIQQALNQIRMIARGFSGFLIENVTLQEGLSNLCASTERLSETACTLELDESLDFLNGDVATHLFGIAQEAITNSLCHGKSEALLVRLFRSGDSIILSVTDQGARLEEKDFVPGCGLSIMKHRARKLGGDLVAQRLAEGGFEVRAVIPKEAAVS